MNKGFIQFPILAIILVVLGFGAGITSTIVNKKTSAIPEIVAEEKEPKKETPAAETAPVSPPPSANAPEESIPTQHTALLNLDREIRVLFNANVAIGPEHYARLSESLNTEAEAGADKSTVGALRIMLEAIHAVTVPPAAASATEPLATPTPNATSEEEQTSCYTDVKPQLTADITDFSKIWKITAPGTQSIEGPKGHSFIWTQGYRVPVYAPTDMIFDAGSYSKDTTESPAQYLLFFKVKANCNYTIKFDHIDEPIDALRTQFPDTPAVADSRTSEIQNKIEFKAGDLIAYTTGTLKGSNWDFGLYNLAEEGILKTQYNSYGIHGYSVCWTDFYTPDAKKNLYRNLLEGPTVVCFF